MLLTGLAGICLFGYYEIAFLFWPISTDSNTLISSSSSSSASRKLKNALRTGNRYQRGRQKSNQEKMKAFSSISIKLSAILYLSVLCAAQDFDFFYFVQQWPGSYCDTRQSCCYPTTGKPAADFGIHGLWPNYNDGSYPSNCDPNSPFNQNDISDLKSSMQRNWASLACPSSNGVTFWSHEWVKHGTCSESVLDQHDYFQAALTLKSQVNVLQALTSAGIRPNGGSYSLSSIKSAIQSALGFTPFIECNTDASGNSQLYQVYLCVDTSGTNMIQCPVFPRGKCGSQIEFPSF